MVMGVPYRIAARLVEEAARRQLTVGEVLELALIEGWFCRPKVLPDRSAAPNQPRLR